MVKIFLTGASGYIGGDVLRVLAGKHPEYEISALNRDPAKGSQILGQFPGVRVVSGDLNDAALLEKEVAQADIVLHLAQNKHMPSVEAIHRGLAKRSNIVYWVQVSGASALAAPEIASATFGEPSDKVYNDLAGVEEIKALVGKYPSRAVDNYLLKVSAESPQVRTAIVFPPIIYGVGGGPCHQRSVQVPETARFTLERGRGAQVGRGLNRWSNVHIHDLSEMFGLLVEKAVQGVKDDRLWNGNGVYFCGSGGEMTFGEISQEIAKAGYDQGLLKETAVDELTPDEADAIFPHASVMLGTNARCEGTRAQEVLGWKPQAGSLRAEIPKIVTQEAEALKRKA